MELRSGKSKRVLKQTSLGFSCKKTPPSSSHTKKSYNSNVAQVKKEASAVDVTDEDITFKFDKPPTARELHIAEKYAMLAEFFEAMESAIKLLRIKRTPCCFTNISPLVETMTSRRFSISHIAQMKHILSNAFLLEKFMIKDERSLCMKPDLKITLAEAASLKSDTDISSSSLKDPFILLRMFQSSLLEFVQSHPNGEDVPEEVLPEPFNKKRHPAIFPVLPKQTSPILATQESTAMSSLLPHTFRRHFSMKESMDLSSLKKPSENLNRADVEKTGTPERKNFMPVDVQAEKDLEEHKKTNPNFNPCLCTTPEKEAIRPKQMPRATTATTGLRILGLETPQSNSILPASPGCTPMSDVYSVNGTPCESSPLDFASQVPKKELPEGNALTPKSPGFASPEPCDRLQSSGSRLKGSTVKRAMAFGGIPRDSAFSLSTKRKASEFTEDESVPLTSPYGTKSTPSELVSIEENTNITCGTETPCLSTIKRQHCNVSDTLSSDGQTIVSEASSEAGEFFSSDTVARSISDLKKAKRWEIGKEDIVDAHKVCASKKGILGIISSDLIRSVQEREKKTLEDIRLGVPATKKRQQMLGSLPKLFNIIRDIYRSSKRSVLTRQELFHKIVSFHTDVVDKAEVEEQFKLLEEIVPEWMSSKVASSGDILYSVQVNVDIQKIQSRLRSAS